MTASEPGQAAVEAVQATPVLSTTNARPPKWMPPGIEAHPRPLCEPGALADASTAVMRYQSPLRYPGAKSGLGTVIGDLIESAARQLGTPELFVEPFAGGASTALRLAGAGIVRRVLLADADPLVARFWQVAAADTEWLIDRMMDEPVTLDRWDHWRAWQPSHPDDRDIAVKCLFLNRTTFSGILHGRAGPIGGRKQESAYPIDCRFNKDALEARLRFVGDLYATNRLADVWCKDWAETLDDVAEWYPQLIPNRVVAYLDPPYWSKSAKLYAHSFDPTGGYAESKSPLERSDWLSGLEHYQLAGYLRRRAQIRWILSYDDHPELTTDTALYALGRMNPSREDAQALHVRSWPITKRLVDLRYSASAGNAHRGKRQELLLTTLPPSRVPIGGRFRPFTTDRGLDSPYWRASRAEDCGVSPTASGDMVTDAEIDSRRDVSSHDVVMRIVSWNLMFRGAAGTLRQGALLRELKPDLILLQEVNLGSAEMLQEAAGADWLICAADLRTPAVDDRPVRSRGVAIAGRGPAPRRASLLPDVPLPERILIAETTVDGTELTAVSYHAPPGVNWGIVKPRQAVTFARWLSAHGGPVVLGADANTPLIDAVDFTSTRTHWHTGNRRLNGEPGDDLLFGPNKIHPLDDGLRRWLDDHPADAAALADRSAGPLAVTHRTGRRGNSPGTDRRFDSIWITQHWNVRHIDHLYDEGIAAGSDHAVIVADLADT